MPRKPRLHFSGAFSHVLSRGNNQQDVFLDQRDYQTFLRYLLKTKQRKPFKLHAFCLMPNHFHLLVEVDQIPLSVIIQRLLSSYTQYFNRRHRRSGHLFQGRYKSILCQKDSYLLELVRYIHLNPVRAKLVNTPSQWEWSGHKYYAGKASDSLVDCKEVLELFSSSGSVRQSYVDFIRDGLQMGSRKDLYPQEKVPFLGEDSFVEQLVIKQTEVIEKSIPSKAKREPLSTILKDLSEKKRIPAQLIQSQTRLRNIVRIRNEFILRAYQAGHKLIDIAKFLGCSSTWISRVVENNGQRIQNLANQEESLIS